MQRFTKVIATGTGLLMAAATLGACGSSSGSASVDVSKLHGRPINILGTGSITGDNAFPDTGEALKAAVADVNATGGIHGHPLKMTLCDNQSDPNIAASCAKQAVQGKDVAVVGYNVLSSSVIPTLEKAGIAEVGNDVQNALEATSKIAFPIGAGSYNLLDAVGIVSKKIGCTKVGSVIIQAPNLTKEIATAAKESIAGVGVSYGGPVYSPLNQTNFTSTIADLQSAGDDCVALAISPQQTTGFLTSWKQGGSKLKVMNPGTTLPPLSKVSTIATGVYIYTSRRMSTDPAAATAVAALKKYGEGDATSAAGMGAYAGVQLLADALRSIKGGTYDAATVLKAMGSLTDATSQGITPPFTTTKENPVKGQERVFNPDIMVYQVNGTSTKTITGFLPIPGIAPSTS